MSDYSNRIEKLNELNTKLKAEENILEKKELEQLRAIENDKFLIKSVIRNFYLALSHNLDNFKHNKSIVLEVPLLEKGSDYCFKLIVDICQFATPPICKIDFDWSDIFNRIPCHSSACLGNISAFVENAYDHPEAKTALHKLEKTLKNPDFIDKVMNNIFDQLENDINKEIENKKDNQKLIDKNITSLKEHAYAITGSLQINIEDNDIDFDR